MSKTEDTRSTSNLPVNYEEQLRAEANAIGAKIATATGDRIRYNGARGFITPDGNEGDTLEVVIMDFVSSNMYYDTPYDSENPSPPACFAIGSEPSSLIPSPNSPKLQAESCSACPLNQFGSGANGRGKACKNTRLVALKPVSDFEDPQGTIWVAAIPPTSIKAFDSYVRKVAAKHGISPVGLVSELYMDPEETFAAPRFKEVRALTAEELAVVMPQREEANERLVVEPDVSEYGKQKIVAPKAAPARRRR